ncbi:MAG: transferrin-binding protein-like solute binding protein [Rhizobiales bacterium]|nr:transferrin-binding protein-like solute binding protein [Hyphomicrobiales bacterium]
MKNLTKLLILFSTGLSLAACQTGGSSGALKTQGYTSTVLTNTKIAVGSSKVDVKRIAKNTVDVTIDGKVYKFTKDDLREDGREDRFKEKEFEDVAGIKKIRVTKTSSDLKRVEMWKVGINRPKDGTYETGYLINGEKPAKLPTAGTAKYTGGFGWGSMYSKTKPGDGRKGFWGNLELNVDFDKSAIDGKLYKIKTRDNSDKEIGLEGEVKITGGKITGSDFTAKVATNSVLTTNLGLNESATGTMDGGFYGHYGSEAVGTISLENKDYKGSFAFDATVEN